MNIDPITTAIIAILFALVFAAIQLAINYGKPPRPHKPQRHPSARPAATRRISSVSNVLRLKTDEADSLTEFLGLLAHFKECKGFGARLRETFRDGPVGAIFSRRKTRAAFLDNPPPQPGLERPRVSRSRHA